MCKKNSERGQKIRTAIRNLEIGEEICLDYNPRQMNISTLRVTASTLGVDLGHKYKVSKKEDNVTITRIR